MTEHSKNIKDVKVLEGDGAISNSDQTVDTKATKASSIDSTLEAFLNDDIVMSSDQYVKQTVFEPEQLEALADLPGLSIDAASDSVVSVDEAEVSLPEGVDILTPPPPDEDTSGGA